MKDCIEITKFVRGISLVKAEYEKHIQNFMLKLFSTTRFAGSKLMLDAITKDGVYKALKEVAKHSATHYKLKTKPQKESYDSFRKKISSSNALPKKSTLKKPPEN